MNDKKLGFGLMRLPLTNADDPKSIDIKHTEKMVDTFIENGFTYFDTAYMYCGFESENATKKALVDRHDRNSYTLATKLHANYIKSYEDCDKVFNEQLKKTGVQYFDYYLLHSLNKEYYKKFEELNCFNWLTEKKKQGLVKHIGFSFHDNAELLDKILCDHPEIEFVQLQINYIDWENEGVQSRKCYETAVKHGKPIIVMEPVKGGTLAKVSPAIEEIFKEHSPDMSVPSWAIRFAASLDNVFMVLSGMSNIEQMNDNIGFMKNFKPLSNDELLIIDKAVRIINSKDTIPCTGCSYCTEGCPMNIPIPKYFTLYNKDLQEVEGKLWRPQGLYYDNLIKTFGAPEACIECGQCEGVCPQKIPIINNLKTISRYFCGHEK